MYQALTQEEWKLEDCKAECSSLMELFDQRLGPCTIVRDLVELGVDDKLQNDPYKGELQNVETFPVLDDKKRATPAWGDQSVNAEILLPRKDRHCGRATCNGSLNYQQILVIRL